MSTIPSQSATAVVLGPEVPNAGDILQRVAEERQKRLAELQREKENEQGRSAAGGREADSVFHKTYTERMGGGVDLLVGALEDKAVLDNYLKFVSSTSPGGGVTSVADTARGAATDNDRGTTVASKQQV
jgi:hypothetical protein